MLVHPQFDPVALQLGPISIHWYGLMYLLAFVGGGLLAAYRAKQPNSGWRVDEVSDFVYYVALGVIIGGRLGSVLFYNPGYYLQHPIEIFYLWEGGMSFHGGLLGVLVALWLFGRKTNRSFLAIGDFIAPCVGLGIAAVRFANFINQELWGRPTDLPWGMVFPGAGPEPRHPSPLYEMALEGIILGIILWVYTSKPRPLGRPSGLFLLGYGLFRFGVEFVREPDANLGAVAFGWMTMGQVLSVPMIALGAWLLFRKPSLTPVTG